MKIRLQSAARDNWHSRRSGTIVALLGAMALMAVSTTLQAQGKGKGGGKPGGGGGEEPPPGGDPEYLYTTTRIEPPAVGRQVCCSAAHLIVSGSWRGELHEPVIHFAILGAYSDSQ